MVVSVSLGWSHKVELTCGEVSLIQLSVWAPHLYINLYPRDFSSNMEPSLTARVTTFPLSLEINLLSSIPKTAIFSTKIILLVSIPHY